MKRKDYIKPFVKFYLITGDSLLYAGSPENNGDTALPGENDPMNDDINHEVQPQPGVTPDPD